MDRKTWLTMGLSLLVGTGLGTTLPGVAVAFARGESPTTHVSAVHHGGHVQLARWGDGGEPGEVESPRGGDTGSEGGIEAPRGGDQTTAGGDVQAPRWGDAGTEQGEVESPRA